MEFSLGGAGTLEQIKRLPLPHYSRIAWQRLVLSNRSSRWRYRPTFQSPIALPTACPDCALSLRRSADPCSRWRTSRGFGQAVATRPVVSC